jgi:hypothetical protein
MERYYSKIQPDLLLHVVFRREDFTPGRVNLLEPDNFLQCAALQLKRGETFKPHKHITRTVTDVDRKAQESWTVIRGRVRCVFYDIDDTILAMPILREGDASFTLHGGHTYIALRDNTRVMEFKTGKYNGQEQDKIFI